LYIFIGLYAIDAIKGSTTSVCTSKPKGAVCKIRAFEEKRVFSAYK